jgi:hypothetical protein
MPVEQRKDFYGQLTFETWSPATIPANSTSDQQFTAAVQGSWLPTDIIWVVPVALGSVTGGLQAGLCIEAAVVTAPDVLTVRFSNDTTGAITPTAGLQVCVVVWRR